MRLAWTAAALALALPSLADARPVTFGAGVGRIQSKANADGDASDTLQVFGRLGFTPRLSGQLELMGIDDPSLEIRTGTALLVVDLGSHPHLVPVLVAGFGFDKASGSWYEASGSHMEGGLGLEYRADGGLTVGFDVRIGGRSIEETYKAYPVEGDIAYFTPINGFVAGEYRSARLTAGFRF